MMYDRSKLICKQKNENKPLNDDQASLQVPKAVLFSQNLEVPKGASTLDKHQIK